MLFLSLNGLKYSFSKKQNYLDLCYAIRLKLIIITDSALNNNDILLEKVLRLNRAHLRKIIKLQLIELPIS